MLKHSSSIFGVVYIFIETFGCINVYVWFYYRDSFMYFIFLSIFLLSIPVIIFPWRGLGFTTHRWSCLWRLPPTLPHVQPGSPGQPAATAGRLLAAALLPSVNDAPSPRHAAVAQAVMLVSYWRMIACQLLPRNVCPWFISTCLGLHCPTLRKKKVSRLTAAVICCWVEESLLERLQEFSLEVQKTWPPSGSGGVLVSYLERGASGANLSSSAR